MHNEAVQTIVTGLQGVSRLSRIVLLITFFVILQGRQFQRVDHDGGGKIMEEFVLTNDGDTHNSTTAMLSVSNKTTAIYRAADNPNIQYIHRFCDETSEEDVALYSSKKLRYTADRDRPGAYWLLSCPKEYNLTLLASESIDRRIRNAGFDPATVTIAQTDDIISGWRIILFDPQDWPAPENLKAKLEEISNLVGWQRVYLVTRSTYRDRAMSRARVHAKIPQRFVGFPYNFTNWIGTITTGVKQYHFAVRDDIVRALNLELANQTKDGGSFVPNPVRIPRPNDVAHFWDVANLREAHWRSKVSQAVLDMGESHNLTVLCHIVGWRAVRGRRSVHKEYVAALLSHKIIVVSQRDRYQDHLRLFEGLASGAFVMTDPMVDFPPGLIDNQTISIYYGLADLRDKILYFLAHEKERLAIAHAGRSTALRRHRQWYRWEDLILGNWTNRNNYGVSKLNPGQ